MMRTWNRPFEISPPFRPIVAALLLPVLLGTAVQAAGTRHARNVILVIGDGAGFNTWEATAMYEGRQGAEFHDAPGWVHLAASTYALRETRAIPDSLGSGLAQDSSLVYGPARAWDGTPVAGGDPPHPFHFAGYRWLRRAPDSANTATTLSTGVKTYSGAINVDGNGHPIHDTLAALARESGRRVGVVTTVPFSHATPAALGGAHTSNRSQYVSIAREMLTGSTLDVIIGAANPDYDMNGRPIGEPSGKDYDYVGGPAVWQRLTADAPMRDHSAVSELTSLQVAALDRWSLRQALPGIESLATGPTPPTLLVVPPAGSTLQQERGSQADPCCTTPGDDPLLPGLPSLATLSRVAINALDDDPDGFFLVVEGGAIDWAMHENQMGRMIEETMDLERGIEAMVEWVETESSWDETLLIVTADHDHLLWGPDSDRIPFDPLRDHGPGRLPGHRWLSDRHSAALVPVFARGAGSPSLKTLAVREDPRRGAYLDQTDLFAVMRALL